MWTPYPPMTRWTLWRRRASRRTTSGRYDIICPPRSAWDLAKAWPEARLEMVTSGHSANEPATVDALVRATDAFADQYGQRS
ncbi:hypothetical protein G6F21_014517 [Rhizopus arrhizus]|nr:hypothetical protein G6F21_014517 [Rhizopus arrhizus]